MAEKRADQGETRFILLCVGMGLAALGWMGWLHTHPDAPETQTLSNVGLFAAAAAGSISCALAARSASGRSRLSWLLFAGACASWAGGQATWTLYESVLGWEVPFPSVADVGYLGFVPLTTAGLLVLPTAPERLASLVRTVVDGLIIATSVLFVSWALVLGPVFRAGAGAGSTLGQVISLAYPLGDVVIITILLFAVPRARRQRSVPAMTLGLLSAGLASFAIGDSGFAYLALSETYASGNLIDGGWFVGFVLILLAACRPPARSGAGEADASSAPGSMVLLPYAPVGVAVVVTVVEQLASGVLEWILAWLLVVVVVLLVVRQVLTLLENMALTRNLEERVRTRTADLHTSEQRFRSLVQHSSDVVTVVDRDGVIVYQSDSAARVFGYDSASMAGSSIFGLVHPVDRAVVFEALDRASISSNADAVVEFSMWHEGERWCQTETVITNLLADPSVGGLVLNTRDVSERKRLETELVRQALHDPLTGLANRALFKNRLEHALVQATRHHRPLAVLFLDLDGFKEINDSLGHAYGDQVLVEVSERLQTCVRTCDTVARLGGDEFAVMLEEVAGDAEVNAVADRIIDSLRSPVLISGHELFVAASVGIALADAGEESADDLLRNADLAMYRAKAHGEGSYCWYEPSMHSAMVQRLELEADLRRALERAELHLTYQPIIDLGTGALIGAEALVRWTHPTRGPVSPAEFIPVAESSGLIKPIGEWVLRTACAQLRAWKDNIAFPLSISVNLSGHQVRQPDLVEVVTATLAESGLDATELVLEMTESILIEQTESTLANLTRLKELGVRLAVDDFGTGYSSLSYLHRFPVDIIKIDRSFVDRLTPNSQESGLASSIVRIGHALKLLTVAEGIEAPHQLEVLRRMGCDRGQGFLMAKPLAAPDFAALLGLTPAAASDSAPPLFPAAPRPGAWTAPPANAPAPQRRVVGAVSG